MKRHERQREKGKIHPTECRVPKNSKEVKKVFLSEQCKEIEEDNRVEKTREENWRYQGNISCKNWHNKGQKQ